MRRSDAEKWRDSQGLEAWERSTTAVYMIHVDNPRSVIRQAWRIIRAWYRRVTAPWRRTSWEE